MHGKTFNETPTTFHHPPSTIHLPSFTFHLPPATCYPIARENHAWQWPRRNGSLLKTRNHASSSSKAAYLISFAPLKDGDASLVTLSTSGCGCASLKSRNSHFSGEALSVALIGERLGFEDSHYWMYQYPQLGPDSNLLFPDDRVFTHTEFQKSDQHEYPRQPNRIVQRFDTMNLLFARLGVISARFS